MSRYGCTLPAEMLPCIEQFFVGDSERPAGRDVYHEVFDTSLFFPLQRKRELELMIRAARAVSPKVVMEIGADKGGGLYHWCKCFPKVEKVIGCEIRGTPYSRLFQEAFPEKDFLWMSHSSYDEQAVDVVRHWLYGDTIDVLFIDGDKLGMEKDFDAYLPYMSSGSLVFMHDVTDREPKRSFERIKARGFATDLIHDVSDAKEAMDREKAGVPSSGNYEGWLRHWKGRSCGVGVIWIGR